MSEPLIKNFKIDESMFPFTMEIFNATGEVVWSTEVTGAGATYIPPMWKDHGPCGARIVKNGVVLEETPPPDHAPLTKDEADQLLEED